MLNTDSNQMDCSPVSQCNPDERCQEYCSDVRTRIGSSTVCRANCQPGSCPEQVHAALVVQEPG
jgi:hypothetical protein